MLHNVHLIPDAVDTISRKFTTDEIYNAKFTYDMQFASLTDSLIRSIIWKI